MERYNIRISDITRRGKTAERLINKGVSSLSDAELLSIVLKNRFEERERYNLLHNGFYLSIIKRTVPNRYQAANENKRD